VIKDSNPADAYEREDGLFARSMAAFLLEPSISNMRVYGGRIGWDAA
jgi:hypothetical protein